MSPTQKAAAGSLHTSMASVSTFKFAMRGKALEVGAVVMILLENFKAHTTAKLRYKKDHGVYSGGYHRSTLLNTSDCYRLLSSELRKAIPTSSLSHLNIEHNYMSYNDEKLQETRLYNFPHTT